MPEEGGVRVGLVGTGHWARNVHGERLAASPLVELAGVHGRNAAHLGALATDLGVPAFGDFDALLDAVDAVAFAVPPDVQAPLAIRAARAGKHLLLEKPIALTSADANRLVEAVEDAAVASIVFFTARFAPAVAEWLADVAEQTWDGAYGHWISSALSAPDSPYLSSTWRVEHGALWDLGPHVMSLLLAALGPIDGVRAAGGTRDLVHLICHHVSGATSTASLTLNAPPAAAGVALSLWGATGTTTMPERGVRAGDAYENAIAALVAQVDGASPGHPCDVRFGAAVVDILEAVATELAAP